MAGVMSTPSTYGKGEQTLTDLGYATPTWYPNLSPDPGVERTDYVPGDSSADSAINSDQYRKALNVVGTGGTVTATLSTAQKRSESQSFALTTSTTGTPSNYITALTPNFDVEPGATYVARCWAAKSVAATSRVYLRMAAGSTDSLSEYGATNPASSVPMTVSAENVNLTAAANVFQELVILATIPAGLTRASLRVYNYLPTTAMTVYFDDFNVVKADNTPFSDSGWIPLPLANSWVDYGAPYPPPAFRKIAGVVYVRGLLKNGTVTNNTVMATLPAGFRPGYDQINPGQMVTPGTGVARIDTNADGTIMGRVGLVAGWTSITLTPFVAEL